MDKYSSEKLKELFLNQIKNGEIVIGTGIGTSTYKMKRGSFKTKNHIKFFKHLSLRDSYENNYVYGDKNVSINVNVSENENIELTFGIQKEYNRFSIGFKTFNDEEIYGCGEQYVHLNLKNKNVPIWVSEHQQVSTILEKLIEMKIFGPKPERIISRNQFQTYYSAPVFTSSMNYAFYCDFDGYAKFHFNKDGIELRFRGAPKKITILTADSQLELIKKMCNLAGISPRVPSWTGDGAILAMQGGTEVLREKYKVAKEKGIKISGIWAQDWCGHVVTSFGYQVYWNWKVDDDLYKGLKEFIEELKADGVHFLGYINTFLKEDAPLYLEAKEKGYLVKRQDGEIYHIKSTTFDAGIVDLTNEEAYNWYKEIIKTNMISFGLDGWMADFGEYLPTDSVVKGGSAESLHNIWPTLWAKCSYDAIREMGREKDIFIFSRAAYSHTPKYTNSMWNGDQHVDFSDEYGMSSVIPATISMACSGCGVVHSDIGGYTTVMWMKRNTDLMLRWSQMNIFSPIYRTHEGNRPTDNVQFNNEDIIDKFSEYSNIFYELKEYRDDVLNEYYSDGVPVMRPLFLYYNDKESRVEKREYLFGRDILVAPILRENTTKRKVYIPEGEWIQFFTGIVYPSGTHEIEASPDMPLALYKNDSKYRNLFNEISNKHFKGDK
ncbi:alpha-glucosidase [bacterium]|nr:alpha-glucosidase [bacterium]